ncbi:AAA family ATPase [Crocinitomicaceae bacterium]|nr:AAA family ATPase [Crocinitomicaceae bacterium]
MPWTVPYNKLDPDQKDFVDIDDPRKWIHISGYAGTGKSVLLVNKIQKVFEDNPNARICIISFTHALLEAFRLGLNEVGLDNRIADRDGRNICKAGRGQIDIVTKYAFEKNLNREEDAIYHDFVFCDEVQDVTKKDLHNLNRSSPESGVTTGDENQSIYSKDPQTKESTILMLDDILSVLDPEVRQLTYGHRITPSVLESVYSLMPAIKQTLLNEFEVAHTRDTDVMICGGMDEEEEVQYVYEQALDFAEDVELTAILLPMHYWIVKFCKEICRQQEVEWNDSLEAAFKSRDYSTINKFFENNGVKIEYVGSNHGSFIHARENNNILLMTWHSSKGMDFQNVFLPFLSAHNFSDSLQYFLPRPLMVAMTRSNYNLTLSYSGEPLDLVRKFKSLECCYNLEIDDSNEEDDSYSLPY